MTALTSLQALTKTFFREPPSTKPTVSAPKVSRNFTSFDEIIEEANHLSTSDDHSDHASAEEYYQRALSIQESSCGYYHEATANVYHRMACLEYTRNYPNPSRTKVDKKKYGKKSIRQRNASKWNSEQKLCRAFSLCLQSLRITYHLHGEDHPATACLLDDLQDFIEDMDVDGDQFCNPIFESWSLQDEAEEIQCDSQASDKYTQALDMLPEAMELERAVIHFRMAQLFQKQKQIEQALSHVCFALLIYPKYLSKQHPRFLAAEVLSKQIYKEVTPIHGGIAPVATLKVENEPRRSSSFRQFQRSPSWFAQDPQQQNCQIMRARE